MASTTAGAQKLRGNLNTFQLLFSIMAFQAPLAGAIAYLSVIIGYGNGLGAPVALVVAGAVLALFAVGYLKMARHVQNPGGFYSFVAKGLGRELGLGASILAIVSYYAAMLGGYFLVGLLSERFVAGTLHGPDISWWVWTLVWMAMVGCVGYFSLDVSAKVLTGFMALEAVIIVAYNVVVVARGGHSGLSGASFLPHNIFSGSPGVAVMFAMLLFSGFEVTVIFRDEVKEPERTIPRAAFGFIALIGLGYAVTAWTIIQALGTGHAVAATAADPSGAVLATVRTFLGATMEDLVTALIVTSAVAGILALHNVIARYGFNLAVDEVLPRPLGFAHRKHGSPHRASVLISILSVAGLLLAVVVGVNANLVYAQLSGMFAYGFVMLLVLTTVAILIFMGRSRPADTTAWHRLAAPGLALVGLLVTLWFATTHLSSLFTVSSGVITALLVVLYGSVVAGAVYARVLKRRRPRIYARIGRQ